MDGSRATDRHRFPGTGTVQGVLQAVVAALFAWSGIRLHSYFSMRDREAPLLLWLVVLLIASLLIGLGVSVDLRRTRAPLSLTGPFAARLAVLAIVVGAALAQIGGWAALVLGALAFVVLDRIAGPAWILGRALVQAWSRRGWRRHDVVEVEGGRAILSDSISGTALHARSELPLELGPAYVDLEVAPRADPYRHDEVSARVRQLESFEARAARARVITTAALGLLSGLLWLALPYCLTLGRELTRAR